MKIPSNELLLKFGSTPGLCTLSEINEIFNWISEFNIHLCAYKAVFGEPVGMSVMSLMDKLDWYVQNKS